MEKLENLIKYINNLSYEDDKSIEELFAQAKELSKKLFGENNKYVKDLNWFPYTQLVEVSGRQRNSKKDWEEQRSILLKKLNDMQNDLN